MEGDAGSLADFPVHGACIVHSERCISGNLWGMANNATEYMFCGAAEGNSLVVNIPVLSPLTLAVPPIA